MNVAQTGVTQTVAQARNDVGGPLFERGHRGARLTAIGERLRLRADVILGECMRTEEEMRQLRGESTGQVSLGLAAEATMRLFPALLASFRERCPRIDVHLTSATSRVLTSWVRDGSLDFALALVSRPPNCPRPGDDAPLRLGSRGDRAPRSSADTGAHARRTAGWRMGQHAGAAKGAATNRLAMLFDAAGLAPPRIAVTTEAVFDTLHCVANTDYLALEPARLVEHAFFREHVAIVAIAERAGPHAGVPAAARGRAAHARRAGTGDDGGIVRADAASVSGTPNARLNPSLLRPCGESPSLSSRRPSGRRRSVGLRWHGLPRERRMRRGLRAFALEHARGDCRALALRLGARAFLRLVLAGGGVLGGFLARGLGVVPCFGAFMPTPARRASDKPIAIACFADFAPCLPSRM